MPNFLPAGDIFADFFAIIFVAFQVHKKLLLNKQSCVYVFIIFSPFFIFFCIINMQNTDYD